MVDGSRVFGQRPIVRPTRGNALGSGRSAQPANRSRRIVGPLGRRKNTFRFPVPLGVALGWENGCPFGANTIPKSCVFGAKNGCN